MPAADVDGEARRHIDALGAELGWKVRAMGTTVACLRVGEQGPAILLSVPCVAQVRSWCTGCRITPPRSASCASETSAVHELDIPPGPCATFTMEAGQRYAGISSSGRKRLSFLTAALTPRSDAGPSVPSIRPGARGNPAAADRVDACGRQGRFPSHRTPNPAG